MKTDLTTSGSFAQSKAMNGAFQNKAIKNSASGAAIGAGKVATTPDYKLDLSSSKAPNAPSTSMPSLTSLPPLPSTPSLPSSSVPDISLEEIAKDELKDKAIKKATEVNKVKVKGGFLKQPAIFFIKGLDLFSSPSKSEGGYAGLGRIAESVEGSRIYGWDQKDEMIEEIKKIHKDFPVILVGHSLGGDTAIEIADELDSLQENFRNVDLLVTIDAIGFSHDIIPQNVKQHLNVFGESSFLLKDGPHVARREDKTLVRNILSPLDHTDIDDDREIQYEVVNLINNTLKK